MLGNASYGNAKLVNGRLIYTDNDYGILDVLGGVGYNLMSNVNMVRLIDMETTGATVWIYPLIVDCGDPVKAEALKPKIRAIIEGTGATCVELDIPDSEFTVSGFFNMELLNIIMLVFACFCVVLSTIPLTLLWAARRRKRVAVQRLLGFSTGLVSAQMFGRLLVIFHIGFAMSYGAYALLSEITDLKLNSFFSTEMLVAYLGALCFNILIAIVPLIQTMKVELGDALRRE